MKVRCVDQSVRLRLRKSDITQLLQTGKVQVQLKGPGHFQLTYSLVTHSDSILKLDQIGTELFFMVPKSEVDSWAKSNQVGIEKEIPTDHLPLHFLLEKDFPCKDRQEEDKNDFFSELAEESPSNC